MSNPAIEVAVTARIDELTKNLKAAEAAVATTAQKIDGTLKQGGGFGQQLGTFAKDQFNKSIGGLANRAGPMLTSTITGLFKDAAQAVAANPNAGFEDILGSMAENLKARVASLPVVGDIAIGIINLINASADEVDRQTDAMIQRGEKKLERLARTVAGEEQLARDTFEASDKAKDPQARLQENLRRIEQQRIADIAAAGDSQRAKVLAENRALLEIKKAKQAAAEQQAAIDKDNADKAQKAVDEANRKAEEAAKRQQELAKQAADAQIEQISRAADARDEAIQRELDGLTKVADKAQERSDLVQQGAGNLVGSIDTALGAFKFAQPDAQADLVNSVNKQIAVNERVARLQEEQKLIAQETKRSIDEIKQGLKGTIS